MTPLVSIIIPTFNREATIQRAVESALRQTYNNTEVIVVDDGSTDGTHNMLRSYGDSIRLVLQLNGGPSSARNHGFRRSTGEIVSFLDSDDSWLPEKIERQVAIMESAGSEIVCCVCNAELKDADGTIASSFRRARVEVANPGIWLNPGEVLATRFLLFNQVVAVRRDAFAAVGGYNESLRLHEDYDLAMRLSRLGPWAILPEMMVVKYNTGGIGICAMQNKILEMEAAKQVVEILLVTSFGPGATPSPVRKLLIRALGDLDRGLGALRQSESSSSIRALLGRSRLSWLRARNSIRNLVLGRAAMRIERLPDMAPERLPSLLVKSV